MGRVCFSLMAILMSLGKMSGLLDGTNCSIHCSTFCTTSRRRSGASSTRSISADRASPFFESSRKSIVKGTDEAKGIDAQAHVLVRLAHPATTVVAVVLLDLFQVLFMRTNLAT